ncbi:hypothetical protein ACPV47_00480 [Vibrio jasicida]
MRFRIRSAKDMPTMATYFRERVAHSDNKFEVMALVTMNDFFNW